MSHEHTGLACPIRQSLLEAPLHTYREHTLRRAGTR